MQNQRAQNLAPVGAAPAKRPGGAVAAVPVSMRRVILVGTLSSVVRQTGAPRHVVDRLALRDPGVRRYDVALDREFSTVWSGGCRIPWRGKTAAKFSMAWKIRKNGGRARPRLGNGLSLWHAALSRADPGNCAGREPRATGAGAIIGHEEFRGASDGWLQFFSARRKADAGFIHPGRGRARVVLAVLPCGRGRVWQNARA